MVNKRFANGDQKVGNALADKTVRPDGLKCTALEASWDKVWE